MPFVPVPKDLTKVKTKIAFNLTKRQMICFGCAALIGVPTYIFTRSALGNEGAVLLMIGLMLPAFFVAMYEKDGQPAEKVLRNMLRAKLWPGKRPYVTESLYNIIEKEGKTFAEQNKAADAAGAKATSQRPSGKKR